jgi:hypothetical protein
MRMKNERVTIAEYAERTGQTESAVRAKVQRQTIAAVRLGGRVYIEVPRGEEPQQEPHNALAAKDAHITDLREQLQAERSAHEQTRRLLGGALERIPALPSGQTREDATPVPDDAPPAPWWRRMFGQRS